MPIKQRKIPDCTKAKTEPRHLSLSIILSGQNYFDANCRAQAEWSGSLYCFCRKSNLLSQDDIYLYLRENKISSVEANYNTSLTSPPRTISWSSVRINTIFGGFSAALETAIEQQEYKARNTVKCLCWRNILLNEKCVPSMLFSWNILYRSLMWKSRALLFSPGFAGDWGKVCNAHATILWQCCVTFPNGRLRAHLNHFRER